MTTINFLDNTSYSAQSLNSIPELFGGEILTTFVNGQTYGVDALNSIRRSITGKGVLLNYQRFKTNANYNGVVTVLSGAAVFESGACLSTTISVNLNTDRTKDRYIFAEHNVATNSIGILWEDKIPVNRDTVMIAFIPANQHGVVDIREFARSNIGNYGLNIPTEYTVDLNGKADGDRLAEYDISSWKHNYLIAVYRHPQYPEKASGIVLYDIRAGKNIIGMYVNSISSSTVSRAYKEGEAIGKLPVYYSNNYFAYVDISKSNSLINLKYNCSLQNHTGSGSVNITLI